MPYVYVMFRADSLDLTKGASGKFVAVYSDEQLAKEDCMKLNSMRVPSDQFQFAYYKVVVNDPTAGTFLKSMLGDYSSDT